MKVLSSITALLFLAIVIFFSDNKKILKNDGSNKSGYLFTINVTKINSKYSEIPAAVFRNKLVIVSSKKIGALGGKIDKKESINLFNYFQKKYPHKEIVLFAVPAHHSLVLYLPIYVKKYLDKK